MRITNLRLLVLALGIGSFAGGAVAGCGGGDSGGGGGTGDDGGSQSDTGQTTGNDGGQQQGNDSGGGSDTSTPPQAMASDLSLYLGQIAMVDGSASTPQGATFAWKVDSAPGGSTIATGSLLNANAAKASFTPDVLGDYKLTLTVSVNTQTSTKQITVHALDAPIFYVHGNTQDPSALLLEVRTAGASGSGDKAIMCPSVEDAGGGNATLANVTRLVNGGLDWLEAPAGTPSRVTFVVDERQGDGGLITYLGTATTDSSCAGTAPRRVDVIPGGGGSINTAPIYAPRISPDGSRVLYIKNDTNPGARLATVGFDGTSAHSHVAPFDVNNDGSGRPDAEIRSNGGPPNPAAFEPRWGNGGKITWVTHQTASRFEIRTADDMDDATVSLAMGCTGNIKQYDVLANGDFLVSGRVVLVDGGTPAPGSDLYVLHPNATTHECEVVKNLTNLQAVDGGSASDAYEFALSPDKSRVAYLVMDATQDAGSTNGLRVAVAAVSGASAPTLVGSVPYGAGSNDGQSNAGPRWVAGGTKLTFAQDAVSVDAGDAGTAVVVVGAAGGAVTAIAAAAPGTKDQVFGGTHISTACSIGYGPGSAFVGFAAFGAFVGLALRRRRRGA